MVVVAHGLNRDVASRDDLDQAYREGFADRIVRDARRLGAVEWVALATCNRIELVSVHRSEPKRIDSPFVAIGTDAVLHLMAVAAGLDSELFGETAVLGQVRAAYSSAVQDGAAGPILGRVFHAVFRSVRRARARLELSGPEPDWGTHVVASIRAAIDVPRNERIAVIGNGQLGRAIVGAFLESDLPRPILIGRDSARCGRLAARYGLEWETIDQFESILDRLDIVIGASGGGLLIRADAVRPRNAARPLVLMDLAMPPNFDRALQGRAFVEVRSIADLGTVPTPADRDARRRQALDWLGPDAASLIAGLDDARLESTPEPVFARDRSRGIVSLVGAGPGDPSLLTSAARIRIEQADVVLHDALVPASILALVPPAARLVLVGKLAGSPRSWEQEEIERRLIAHARAGLRVVRLKGGDPFLFGRGGEEIDRLRRAGVRCEVIPGISAAFGAAAAFQIPLTARSLSRSVRFCTATTNDEESTADRAAAASSDETLVYYMVGRRLDAIARKLLDGRRPSDSRVALIERATWPDETCTWMTLRDLSAWSSRNSVCTPAILIVGPAGLAGIASPDAPSRSGRCVALIGILQDFPRWSQRLRGRVDDLFELPLLRLAEAPHTESIQLTTYRTIRFSDAHTIDPFLKTIFASGRDLRCLHNIRLEAANDLAAARLREHGLIADPPDGESRTNAQRLVLTGPEPSPEPGDRWIVYDLEPMEADFRECAERLAQSRTWIFTSAPAAEAFIERHGPAGVAPVPCAGVSIVAGDRFTRARLLAVYPSVSVCTDAALDPLEQHETNHADRSME